MTAKDIEKNVTDIIDNFSKEEFIYDLLLAYGSPKATITRLRSGDYNLSKNEGEILLKSKLFFKIESAENLFSAIEESSQDENILKHKPRFIIVTDYDTFLAIDLKTKVQKDIKINELPRHYDFFLPLAGSEVYNTKNDNKADREAAYKMAELYDGLISANEGAYNSKENVHNLNIFLSRLLFCLFAEDTGIFEENSIFTNSLGTHTQLDGSDVHTFLDELFERLNTSKADNFPAFLADGFPYVNGGLFRDRIATPKFTASTRKLLIGLGDLQWQEINPDIFGSMIQAVVLPDYRSDLGMHYTSVENILKLIKPLFLDELYDEFEKHNDSVKQLEFLIFRISNMKFFDPACGSGNFLIITYKEIRLLEIKILQRIFEILNGGIIFFTQIQLSQFYGIELDDFAHEMAILSLWLAEHQMNIVFEEQLAGYGQSKPILPLKESGRIVQGNSARIRWEDVCSTTNEQEVYIIGNPPYLGARLQDANQKKDMSIALNSANGYNNIDYIGCWFYKAKEYISNKNAKMAFVSTNSICQGEQVQLLWPHILGDNIEIFFTYRSFKWTNNAKGNAGVTVAIIGLRNISLKDKYIYDGNIKNNVKNISAYLLNCRNVYVTNRSKSISNFPEICFGNMANDGGNLLLSEIEKNELLSLEPESHIYIRKFVGALEFIRGVNKYCIWIEENQYQKAYQLPQIKERIDKVQILRENSKRLPTKKLSKVPYRFGEVRYQSSDLIIIPRHSSEAREYIPMGLYESGTIVADSAMTVYGAETWLFGVIHSNMHMVWIDTIGGKIKTDYRYSAHLCYNTFPFPQISNKQKESLNLYVFGILDERAKHPEKTMAQLYDPDKMPAELRQAHKELDEAIERCYRLQPFKNDTERLEYLFKLYEEMSIKDTLFAKQPKRRIKKG